MNALIIGGTNRTAINIAKELEINGYSIDCMTYRDEKKIVDSFKNWSYLDFYETDSVDKFLIEQVDKKYDKIIFLVSNSTWPSQINFNALRDGLRDFYGTFCVNYLLLVYRLISSLSDTGSIVFISSSAAETGCNDPVYSSGKALVQSYVISLNNFLNENQSAVSISPGTIFGSSFYESLPLDSPIRLNIDAMTYPEELAEVIINAYNYKGKVVKVGWEKGWEN